MIMQRLTRVTPSLDVSIREYDIHVNDSSLTVVSNHPIRTGIKTQQNKPAVYLGAKLMFLLLSVEVW